MIVRRVYYAPNCLYLTLYLQTGTTLGRNARTYISVKFKIIDLKPELDEQAVNLAHRNEDRRFCGHCPLRHIDRSLNVEIGINQILG